MIRFRKQSHSRGPITIPPRLLSAGYAAVLLLIGLTAASCAPTSGGFNVRGNAVYAKGGYDEAIRLYRKSLALNPRLPAVNANLGWAYLKKKNYDEAVVYLKRSLSYKPEYKHAMRGLGRALFRKKDYKEALRYFRRIVEADPSAVEELDYLGWTHLNMGNHDLAIPAHRRVLSRKPRHQSALNGLGISLYRKGRHQEALGHFRRLLAIKPDSLGTQNWVAWSHLKLRQFDEAIPRFRKVLARNPKNESALEGLGRGLYAKGDYKAAAGRFKHALEINAKNQNAKTWLGFAYFREGKFSEAEKLMGGFGRIGVEIKKQGGGLLVVRVAKGSPAAKAGLSGGDEIRAINGETVQDIPTFIRRIREAGIGGRVALRIQRGGTTTVINVTPEKRPQLSHPAFDRWYAKRRPGGRGTSGTVARATRPAGVSGWKSSGTGFLLRGTSHILTKFHVVQGASRVQVTFPSGEVYPGRVEARDANNDLAIVRLKGMSPKGGGFVPDLASRVEAGKRIHAIGYPLGAGLSRKPSIVSGQVSAETGLKDNIAQFRMTAPINEGNSGGPVINARGVLIGIASSGLVQQGVEAIRFATKISAASLLLGQTRLARKFSISVQPKEAPPKTPQAIFRKFSPYVVLIETR